MKAVRCIMKLVAVVMALGAVACCIIAYWDKIQDGFSWLSEKVQARRAAAESCCDLEDYADWDE